MKTLTIKQFAKELEENVKWLYESKCGCCHWKFTLPNGLIDDTRHWFVVVGWSDGFDENEDGYFSDGTWQICSKIGYQKSGYDFYMQTDMDIDFLMPCFENGDCYDTCSSIPKDCNWEQLAESLIKEFNEVVKTFVKDDYKQVA